ncbi:MAG: acyltransferase family protein [Clostridia bacterium]|nr:acyltransferase family protein [Clostridia bacterium]
MKKSIEIDKHILVLQFLGILFVVFGHTQVNILNFSGMFPYYSFHMPLWIFISGYLFNTDKLDRFAVFIKKKTVKLLLPFYGWLLVYCILRYVFRLLGMISYGKNPTLHNFFVMPWTKGCQYGITSAWWFIPILFSIEIICFFKEQIFSKIKKYCSVYRILIFGLFVLIGMAAVYQARIVGSYQGMKEYQSYLCKVLFLLPFFDLGIIVKKYKSKIQNIKSIYYFGFILILQIICIELSHNSISAEIVHSKYHTTPLITYIVAVNGIFLWFRISEILEPALGKLKLVYEVGRNTWSILLHHQMIIFILNWSFVYIGKLVYRLAEIRIFDSIDIKKLISKPWYFCKSDELAKIYIIYAVVSVIGSLIIHNLVLRLKKSISINKIKVKK